jgi:glycosyltransferase involved in cell wall biosynthesis
MQNKVVYIVAARRGRVNDRIEKLMELRGHYDRLVLVAMNGSSSGPHRLTIRPLPNPTNICARLGMISLKRTLDRLLYFPSPAILFVKPCVRSLRGRIQDDLAQGKDVCLLTCAPPHDVVLAGLSLKRQFPSLRWLIDWQDLWSYDENYFGRVPGRRKAKLLRLEREAFDSADLNIVTNAYAEQVLIEHYKVPPDRLVAIHHHFSRDELPEASTSADGLRRAGAPIRIGFLGTLFKPPRVPGAEVVDAIRRLRNSGINVELHVYGSVPAATIPQSVAELQADGVHLHGSLGHKAALKEIAKYDLLLLILADLPNCRAVMSIKLPHYLLTGRSIIAIVPQPSAIASVVQATGSGVVIPASDDWYTRLRELLIDTSWSQKLVRNTPCIDTFSWEAVAEDWRRAIDGDERRAEMINAVSPVPSS